jgi:hypothetical protein
MLAVAFPEGQISRSVHRHPVVLPQEPVAIKDPVSEERVEESLTDVLQGLQRKAPHQIGQGVRIEHGFARGTAEEVHVADERGRLELIPQLSSRAEFG